MSPPAPHRSLRRMSPSPMVRVHIERLVLHAVAHADAGRVAAALEAELAARAAEPGQVFAASASAARVAPVLFNAPEGAERIGRAAAGAVWSSITRSGGATR
jgi:hypothetical protein